jgi:hypothetical protein
VLASAVAAACRCGALVGAIVAGGSGVATAHHATAAAAAIATATIDFEALTAP